MIHIQLVLTNGNENACRNGFMAMGLQSEVLQTNDGRRLVMRDFCLCRAAFWIVPPHLKSMTVVK